MLVVQPPAPCPASTVCCSSSPAHCLVIHFYSLSSLSCLLSSILLAVYTLLPDIIPNQLIIQSILLTAIYPPSCLLSSLSCLLRFLTSSLSSLFYFLSTCPISFACCSASSAGWRDSPARCTTFSDHYAVFTKSASLACSLSLLIFDVVRHRL
jgi:hypothetical protein